MKHIKNYKSFINEKNLPDITIGIDDILEPLKKEIDLFTTFEIDPDQFDNESNLHDLYNLSDFNNFLRKNDLKKGKFQNTKDNETLLNDNYILTFFFVYHKDSLEIEEPKFIFIQYYNKESDELSNIKVFRNRDNINDFYRKLTDSNLEIKKGKKTYIYKTSNSGNNWELKNPDMVKGDFKPSLDFHELEDLLGDKKINIE